LYGGFDTLWWWLGIVCVIASAGFLVLYRLNFRTVSV
jgi:hypothetical protein